MAINKCKCYPLGTTEISKACWAQQNNTGSKYCLQNEIIPCPALSREIYWRRGEVLPFKLPQQNHGLIRQYMNGYRAVVATEG